MNGPDFINEMFQARPNLRFEYERAYSYGSSGRWYHNMYHILDLLELQEKYFPDMSYNGKIAILFHDIFYLPGGKANEQKSADIALEYMELLDTHSDYSPVTVYQLIKATDHLDQCFPFETMGQVLDLDLAGLADYYEINRVKIREEFSDYSDEEWIIGRKKFLEFFLGKRTIYQTKLGKDLWESAARYNMEQELIRLEKA